MNGYIKTIELDAQKQSVNERVIREHDVRLSEELPGYDPLRDLRETVYTRHAANLTRMNFLEALVQTPDAANMLRDGIKFLAFNRYREVPAGWEQFVQTETSVKPQEEYLRDAAIGVLDKVKSGDAIKVKRSTFEGGVTIKNDLYANLIEIAMDEIRFDRIGKVRQIAQEMGRAGRMTEAKAAFDVLTTTGNYVRNSTTGDNDVGANTQTLTFNGISIETAVSIIGTAKDRKSGSYLGFNADTLIVGPRLEYAAKQLLMSDTIERSHGATSAEVRGTGTRNPFFNIVNRIIVSPWFSSSYSWAIMDSSMMPLIFQRVEPFNVMQQGANESSETYMTKDSLLYRVSGYFGVGMVDDRCVFYSDSTTAPTVS